MPKARPLPTWILAGSASPNLQADEVLEPEGELATPPPPPPCPVHGWACPRLGPVAPVEVEAETVAPVSPSLPSPTPATASSSPSLGLRLPAPAAALGDVFNNGAGSSAAAPAPTLSHCIRFVGSRSVLEAIQAGQNFCFTQIFHLKFRL
jgi:hypothetical protein